MPNHPNDGAEDAALALTMAHVPNLLHRTGGNCFATLVPLGHDETVETVVANKAYLSVLGDEDAEADDRYAIYYWSDPSMDDVLLHGGLTLAELVRHVRQARKVFAEMAG